MAAAECVPEGGQVLEVEMAACWKRLCAVRGDEHAVYILVSQCCERVLCTCLPAGGLPLPSAVPAVAVPSPLPPGHAASRSPRG